MLESEVTRISLKKEIYNNVKTKEENLEKIWAQIGKKGNKGLSKKSRKERKMVCCKMKKKNNRKLRGGDDDKSINEEEYKKC